MLRSVSPAQDDTNGWKSHSQTTRKSFTELIATACKDSVVYMATPEECTLSAN